MSKSEETVHRGLCVIRHPQPVRWRWALSPLSLSAIAAEVQRMLP